MQSSPARNMSCKTLPDAACDTAAPWNDVPSDRSLCLLHLQLEQADAPALGAQAQPALSEDLYAVFETATAGERVMQAAPLPEPLSLS